MANQNPDQDRHNRKLEEPGDENAADIVSPTGEEMPRKTHDEVGDGTKPSTRVNDEDKDPVRRDSPSAPQRSHDNPRTGRISDW